MTHTSKLGNVPFINTSWAVAHNSFANTADGWKWNAQQTFDLKTLYEIGVRGYMLDIHYHNNEISLCHDKPGQTEKPGKCLCTYAFRMSMDTPPTLSSTLDSVYEVINEHPKDIIILFLESYVPTVDVAKLFDQHNLTNYLLKTSPNDPSLIVNDLFATPLIVFSDYGKANDTEPLNFIEGFHYTKHYKESKYNLAKYSRCEDRDQISRTLYGDSHWNSTEINLFLLNHFYWNSVNFPYTNTYPNINDYHHIKSRSSICKEEFGLFTNFIALDYIEYGNNGGVFDFVEEQNRETLSKFTSDNNIHQMNILHVEDNICSL